MSISIKFFLVSYLGRSKFGLPLLKTEMTPLHRHIFSMEKMSLKNKNYALKKNLTFYDSSIC